MPSSGLKPVLLVDGYNVIGAWSCLQKTCQRYGLEAAREELIEALVNYSAFKGLDTQIVFDAHYQDTASNCETITSNLMVYYTEFGQTADTYIEKFCAAFRSRLGQPRLIVATSDRAQQLTVLGYGAEWLSAQQLGYDIESTARRLARKQRSKNQPSSRFLVKSLDARSQQLLAQWRKGLK